MVVFEFLLLASIFYTDLRDRVLYLTPILLLGLVGAIDQLVLRQASALSVGLGALLGAGFFGLQSLFSKGKLVGEGDVYLGLALGLVFGWKRLLAVLLVSYVLGSLISLVCIALGIWKRTERLPLGAFLALGSACLLCVDDPWRLLGFAS